MPIFTVIIVFDRFICKASPEAAEQFEALLFQPFQVILQQDIAEFTPYVFQLMGQLLSFNTRPELPVSYQQMLPPLVQPVLWSQQGMLARFDDRSVYVTNESCPILTFFSLNGFVAFR